MSGDRAFGRLFLTRQPDTFDMLERLRVVEERPCFAVHLGDAAKQPGLLRVAAARHGGSFNPATHTLSAPRAESSVAVEQHAATPVPPGTPRTYAVTVLHPPAPSYEVTLGVYAEGVNGGGVACRVVFSADGGGDPTFSVIHDDGDGRITAIPQADWNVDTFGAFADRHPSGQALSALVTTLIVDCAGAVGPTRLAFATRDGRVWPAHVFTAGMPLHRAAFPCRVDLSRAVGVVPAVVLPASVRWVSATVRAPELPGFVGRAVCDTVETTLRRGRGTSVGIGRLGDDVDDLQFVGAWRVAPAAPAGRTVHLKDYSLGIGNSSIGAVDIRIFGNVRDARWVPVTTSPTSVMEATAEGDVDPDALGFAAVSVTLGQYTVHRDTFPLGRFGLSPGDVVCVCARAVTHTPQVLASLTWLET